MIESTLLSPESVARMGHEAGIAFVEIGIDKGEWHYLLPRGFLVS